MLPQVDTLAKRGGDGDMGRGMWRWGGIVAGVLLYWAGALPVRADGVLAGRTIVVDPGHGGIDGGAVAYERFEKNITLPVGLDLAAMLRNAGATVYLTRTDDTFVSLAERSALANRLGASAFVAVHVNALADPSFRGLTTFYGGPAGYVTGVRRSPALVAASSALAADVQSAGVGATGEVDRGIHAADYYVLGNAAVPAILVETGYMTNADEGSLLADPAYQQRIASGIAAGIVHFFASGEQAPRVVMPVDAGTAAVAAPAVSAARRYVVQTGDTLSALAVRFNVSEAALRAANGLSDSDRLLAGRAVSIPGAVGASAPTGGPSLVAGDQPRYVVQSGDTLSALAFRFGVSQRVLQEVNGLPDPSAVETGQRLVIPQAGQRAAPAVPTGPAATSPGRRYRVAYGDTLSGIALQFRVPEVALLRANGLRNANQILADRYLTIPG